MLDEKNMFRQSNGGSLSLNRVTIHLKINGIILLSVPIIFAQEVKVQYYNAVNNLVYF